MNTNIWGDTHMTSMKIVQFSRPPPPVFSRYVQNSSTPLALGVQFQMNLPSPNDKQSIKRNIIQGWPLYIIRSFLQVGFRFQYQLINLAWLSIEFFPFSWSQPCPQSNLKKLKTSFSLSSYSEKLRWGQGWVEASLSAISCFYKLVCAVA